jgi:hypothetical protein
MKTIQEKAIELFWSLDRDETFIAGDYSIIYCSRGFVVLNDKPVLTYNEYYVNPFEIFSTIEDAMDSVPEEDLHSNPYID